MSHSRSLPRAPGVTEENTEDYHGSMNGQYKDHGPLRARERGVTERIHGLSGSRAPVSAQPLDHLPGYGDNVPVVV
jgi:hypothetical protein